MSSHASSRRQSSRQFSAQGGPGFGGPGNVDWVGLEQKFMELKGYLSEPSLSFSNSSAQRSKQRENVELGLEAIIEVGLSVSNVALSDGNYSGAIEGGLKTLRFVQDMYGPNSVEQIEPYFLLAKAYQHLKKYKQAEEFLSIANWTVIKNPTTPPHIRAELHQNFGLLYVSKGQMEQAVEHLATSIYYLSLLHGTDHLITSFGYFNLGNVFSTQGKLESSSDFLKKVTEIWHTHLIEVLNQEQNIGGGSKQEKSIHALDKLDEYKLKEAGRMFEQILTIQMDRYGENHIEVGKIFLVLGLYHWYNGEMFKTTECLEKARDIMQYVLGDSHEMTQKAKNLLMSLHKGENQSNL